MYRDSVSHDDGFQGSPPDAISGGMNIVKEARGSMDADAGHMTKEIAERAEAFYKRQGWL